MPDIRKTARKDRRQSTRCPRPARSAARWWGAPLATPPSGQRWATGGLPGAMMIEAHRRVCWRRLTATRFKRTPRTVRRSHRRHGACRRCSTARRSAAPLRTAASAAPATSGHPWPSSLSTALRSYTLGVVPRACLRRRRPRTCLPSRRAACAKSRTPSAPAASIGDASPIPVSRSKSALRITIVGCAHGAWGGQVT